MVLNATFNNISAISCLSVLLVEEIGVPPFLNDLETFLEKENLQGLKTISEKSFEEHLNIYFKFGVMLSVEDTVIMTKSAIIGN